MSWFNRIRSATSRLASTLYPEQGDWLQTLYQNRCKEE